VTTRQCQSTSSGTGGVGGEEKSGCQEEEEGSRRRRRIGVHWDPVQEGGKVTLTQYDLIMPRLIAHDRNDPTTSLRSFLV